MSVYAGLVATLQAVARWLPSGDAIRHDQRVIRDKVQDVLGRAAATKQGPTTRICPECWSLEGWDEQAGWCYDCGEHVRPKVGLVLITDDDWPPTPDSEATEDNARGEG